MAFAATTQWDVRTTGSDSNGGGFDTSSAGTDYSQQDAAQVTYTDLVIGATNTQATSAAFPFGAAHVGNIINITGGTGFTVQRVQVVSVAGTTATFDKALGTAGSTGGGGKLGGACATVSPIVLILAANSNNTIHIKSGTYTHSASIGFGGLTFSSITMTGYGTTHNDGGTPPLLTTATNSINLIGTSSNGSTAYILNNINLSSTAATRGSGIGALANSTALLSLNGCVLDGFSYGVNGTNAGSYGWFAQLSLRGTEIKNSVTAGVNNSGNSRVYIGPGSWIHGTTAGTGVEATLNNSVDFQVDQAVISNNSSHGVVSQGINNSITATSSNFASNGGDGITLLGNGNTSSYLSIVNNIFYGNTGYGVNASVSTAMIPGSNSNNAYGSNTAGARQSVAVGANDKTLTANPFTSSVNFLLNTTAGGGAVCAGAGYVGSLGGSRDIGAVQSAGGGSAVQRCFGSAQ